MHVFRFHLLISGWQKSYPIIEKQLHRCLGLHDSLPIVLNFLLLLKYLNICSSGENKQISCAYHSISTITNIWPVLFYLNFLQHWDFFFFKTNPSKDQIIPKVHFRMKSTSLITCLYFIDQCYYSCTLLALYDKGEYFKFGK